MTTTIKVISHNNPALVQQLDRTQDAADGKPAPDGVYGVVNSTVVYPEDSECTFHCHTTRMVQVTDLEMDDPRAKRE